MCLPVTLSIILKRVHQSKRGFYQSTTGYDVYDRLAVCDWLSHVRLARHPRCHGRREWDQSKVVGVHIVVFFVELIHARPWYLVYMTVWIKQRDDEASTRDFYVRYSLHTTALRSGCYLIKSGDFVY